MTRRAARLSLSVLLASSLLPIRAGEPTVRIGVLGLLEPVELTLRPAPGSVLELAAGKDIRILEGAQTAEILLTGGNMKVRFPGASAALPVRSVRATGRGGAPGRFVLGVRGRMERTFHGRLDVIAAGDVLLPVVEMELLTAVASVVAAELSVGAPPEALKAQAVVARSYYVAHRRRHRRFDFCDTTHCQLLREPPAPNRDAYKAAEATRAVVLSHRGQVIPSLYSASCGGRTRTLAEVGMAAQDYPYYAIQCSYCLHEAKRWQSRLGRDEAAAILAHANTESVRIAIGRVMGWKRIPSNNYTIQSEDGAVVLHGSGRGHGVGLCQTGAVGMAREGADYRSILRRYFPNAVLSSH